MYDRVNATNFPRKYAVEGGKSVLHNFTTPATVGYGFSLHGPNGFVRQFGGKTKPLGDVSLRYDPENVAGPSVVVELTNFFTEPQLDFFLTDNAYGGSDRVLPVSIKEPVAYINSVQASQGWYDLSVRCVDTVWRFMGRLETGEPSTQDPAMSSGFAPTTAVKDGFPVGLEGSNAYGAHLPMPEWYRTGARSWSQNKNCASERDRRLYKDECWDFGYAHLRQHDEL